MTETTQQPPKPEEKPEAQRGSILLVDDDKFLQDMYSMKFVQQHYAVQSALSVEEALGILRGGFAADAILFDLTMPERDGFSFLEALGQEKLAPKAVKIALTNQTSDAEKMKAQNLGANEYLVKATLIPSEVVNTVGNILSKHGASA